MRWWYKIQVQNGMWTPFSGFADWCLGLIVAEEGHFEIFFFVSVIPLPKQISAAVTRPERCMPPQHVGRFGSLKGGTQDFSVMLENVIRYTQLSVQREILPASCCSHLTFDDFCSPTHNCLPNKNHFWKVFEENLNIVVVSSEKDEDFLMPY